MACSDSLRGRGAASNPPNRFEPLHVAIDPAEAADGDRHVETQCFRDHARTVLTRNDSPDVPCDVTLNPYRGCEHGCTYCYARPTHEYLGLSAGLDFETRILVKEDAPQRLREELARPSWRPAPIAIAGVTDAWQPVERSLQLTRRCLAVLADARQPVSIVTKSALVARDVDLLRDLAAHRAVHVMLSVTTLDEDVRRAMEPRAAAAELRFETLARLAEAGIPCGVMVAPIVPGLTDHEVPAILARAAAAGARFAAHTMLRLPHGLPALFAEWLERQLPGRARKVLSQVREVRGGQLNDTTFGSRMQGEGPLADLVRDMFVAARRRTGLDADVPPLSAASFRRPTAQRSLFDRDPDQPL